MIVPPLVTLTDIEIAYSDYVAANRMADIREHHRHNVADLVGYDNEERNHIIGALGEHAFAKWLAVEREPNAQLNRCPICLCYSGTVNTFSFGGDVGRYQVRTRTGDRPLIVREKDHDRDVFVLVIARDVELDDERVHVLSATYEIVGWLYAVDAKQYRLRRDPGTRGAAYFVPREELRPMFELPKEVRDASQEEASATRA